MKQINKGKNSYFELGLILICSNIGVGFITGSEIKQFFSKFGAYSLFGILIYALLNFILLNIIILSSNKQGNSKSKLKDDIVTINLLILSAAMFSGLREILKSFSNNGWLLFYLISIILVLLILYFGIKSFKFYNYIIIIFVTCVTLLICKQNFASDFRIKFNFGYNKILCQVIASSCMYIFINIVALRPMICEFNLNFNIKRSVVFSAIISLTLAVLVYVFNEFLIKNAFFYNQLMPVLVFMKGYSKITFICFLVGAVLALLSTEISCLFGIKTKLKNLCNDNLFSCIISLFLVLIFANFNFQIFIKFLYPVVGVLNFIIFIFEVFETVKLRHFSAS